MYHYLSYININTNPLIFFLDSPYYYYYNKRLEYTKCIKCSQNCVEYFLNYNLTASSITM